MLIDHVFLERSIYRVTALASQCCAFNVRLLLNEISLTKFTVEFP